MVQNNGVFPAIKGNPTTNYCITDEDRAKERIYLLTNASSPLPHERYIGELETKL